MELLLRYLNLSQIGTMTLKMIKTIQTYISSNCKKISDTLHLITVASLIVGIICFLLFSFMSIGYSYFRGFSLVLLFFSIFALCIQIALEKYDNQSNKYQRKFIRLVLAILLVTVSFFYKISPSAIMQGWDCYQFKDATILYCYCKQDFLFGEGDRYAILQTTKDNIHDLLATMRPFDEEKDWWFGGYYLKYPPEKFSRCMVSDKLGREYFFEINENEIVIVHVWMPAM